MGAILLWCAEISAPSPLPEDTERGHSVSRLVAAERAARREELVPKLITSLKVDKDANMGIIGDIKKVLREENALKINYGSKQGEVQGNLN